MTVVTLYFHVSHTCKGRTGSDSCKNYSFVFFMYLIHTVRIDQSSGFVLSVASQLGTRTPDAKIASRFSLPEINSSLSRITRPQDLVIQSSDDSCYPIKIGLFLPSCLSNVWLTEKRRAAASPRGELPLQMISWDWDFKIRFGVRSGRFIVNGPCWPCMHCLY